MYNKKSILHLTEKFNKHGTVWSPLHEQNCLNATNVSNTGREVNSGSRSFAKIALPCGEGKESYLTTLHTVELLYRACVVHELLPLDCEQE